MSLTTRGAYQETLPALAKPAPMTASLAYHVRGDAVLPGSGGNPDDGVAQAPHLSTTRGRPSAADIAEAQRKLPEAEQACQPPSQRRIGIWLARMETLPYAPKGEAATQKAYTAICLACSELPQAVFTTDTAIIALQRFKQHPSPADVYELLTALARPYRDTLAGLRRVAALALALPRPAQPREVVTPESEAHVAAVVDAFVAERSFNQPVFPETSARKPGRDGALSDMALVLVYEAAAKQGVPGAQARVDMLRAKLCLDPVRGIPRASVEPASHWLDPQTPSRGLH